MNIQKGFTLVELSIVLVIIGLIVGGVVGGQSLINSTKINKVVVQLQGYKMAINTFELQYDALPGDMVDGYEYWGDGCADSGGSAAVEAACNGDGNHLINGYTEEMMTWKHLQLAGILPGDLTGLQDNTSAPSWANIGSNVPKAPFEGTGFHISEDVWSGWPSFGRHGHNISLGSAIGDNLNGGGITTTNAKAIDKKMDDGKADGGAVRPNRTAAPDPLRYACTGGVNPLLVLSGSYDLTETGRVCLLLFFFD
jgi:prepilin-type N-terminal cleavage/methylation domain-containing protein